MTVPAETLGPVAHNYEEAKMTDLAAMASPDSVAAEQYRMLLARLDRASAVKPLRTVAITSCARGEGRSTTAMNLALTVAREGREVALVECDLKRPSLGAMFELAQRPGMAEVVEGKADLPQALTRVNGVTLLLAGESRDPAASMRSPRFASTLDSLRSSFPLVILDLPPALAMSDGGRLAAAADGVVLVVRAGVTPRDLVRMTVESLSGRLLGLVLNGVDEPGYARYLESNVA